MKKTVFLAMMTALLSGLAYCDELSDITGSTASAQTPAGKAAAGLIGNISMAGLLWGLVFSSVGVFAFMYGRKRSNAAFIVIGILLIAYPYVVQQTMLIILVGAALSGALYFFRR